MGELFTTLGTFWSKISPRGAGDSQSVSTATGIKYNLQRACSPRSHPFPGRPSALPTPSPLI